MYWDVYCKVLYIFLGQELDLRIGAGSHWCDSFDVFVVLFGVDSKFAHNI